MDLNLKDRVALVTGAGQGIGRATVLTFAKEGTNVVVNDIDMGVADDVAKEAEALGVQAIAVKADVTSSVEVRQMVKDMLDKFSRLDILVNNAGVGYASRKFVVRKLFHETTPEDWPREINVGLYGLLNCTRESIQPMMKQKRGSIVNISSDAGRAPSPRNTVYGAGKGAIIAFTRNLAAELGSYGIRVNCVCPGVTKTPRIEALKSGSREAAMYYQELEAMAKRAPSGRMGMPQEIANVVAFLASDACSFVTGQTVSVNGGRIMP